jgi:hypothetical protein
MDGINQKKSSKTHINLSDMWTVVFVLFISLPLLLVNTVDFQHGLNPISFLVAGLAATWSTVLLAAFLVYQPIQNEEAIVLPPATKEQDFAPQEEQAEADEDSAKKAIKNEADHFADLTTSQLPPAPPTRHKVIITLTPRLLQSPAFSA